jgi:hypothetical protein
VCLCFSSETSSTRILSWIFLLVLLLAAYDASKTEWVKASEEACPKTVALLKSLPGIRTALFSRLGPKTTLSVHQGWGSLANYVLRCHLPLVVPDAGIDGVVAGAGVGAGTGTGAGAGAGAGAASETKAAAATPPLYNTSLPPNALDSDGSALPFDESRVGPCALVVQKEVVYHKEGSMLLFDDSLRHYAFNRHPTESRVVLLFDIARPEGLPIGVATGEETEGLHEFIQAFGEKK